MVPLVAPVPPCDTGSTPVIPGLTFSCNIFTGSVEPILTNNEGDVDKPVPPFSIGNTFSTSSCKLREFKLASLPKFSIVKVGK